MQNLATRISNVIFWISIAGTAIFLGLTAHSLGDRWFYEGKFNDTGFASGTFTTIFFTVVWVIVQYLFTGKIEILNKKIVAWGIALSIIIGGATGVNDGLSRKKLALEEKEKTAAAAKQARELEWDHFIASFNACKDKWNVFKVARQDQDYQMAKDLYDIYAQCMLKNKQKIPEWSRDIFEQKD